MADKQGINERVTLAYMDYRADWWYDDVEDKIVLEMLTDEHGDVVPLNSRKADNIRHELRTKHIE